MSDTTTITPEERAAMRSFAEYAEKNKKHLTSAHVAGNKKELRLLTALEAAEASAEQAESSLARAYNRIKEQSDGIEKIAAANHALAAKAQAAETESAKLREQVSALLDLNDVDMKLLDASLAEAEAISAHDDYQTGRTLDTETRLKSARASLFAAYDKGTTARAKCEALGLKVTPSQQGPHNA